ncbi:MFS transporter [Nocardia shimofusensis]|uniref:MFS transporter n=1 Tax=Nocardia shimofusensis TaxID=228596 RepID=UPI0008328F1E|nr:MFS transporter [Nocardia shimofusensis]
MSTPSRGQTAHAAPTVPVDRAIICMLLAVFGVGTVEYLVAGVLPEISGDVGVSEGTAGLLVTVYAVTVMIGGPLMTVATSSIRRTPLIVGSMALFIAGNVLTAFAPNFAVLVIARVITALPHATFFAVCLVLATSLVEPEYQGRVIARITLGLNLATVLGVPLGTLIGQQIGWRASFLIIAVFQAVVTVALLASTRHAPEHRAGNITSEITVFSRGPVLWAIGLTALSQAALFVVFTYIAPYLTEVAGVATEHITVVLFLFGLGSVLGNQLGGYFADRSLDRTLYVALSALTVALAVLFFAGEFRWFAIGWMFVLGAAGFSIIPPLASKLIGAAAEAPHLAATVNIAGFQLANAAGAWIGSVTLGAGGGLGVLPLVGTALAAAAVLLLALARRAAQPAPGPTSAVEVG